MYPTVVVVLVETQRSMMDLCDINPSNANKPAGSVTSEAPLATSEHLPFAVGSVRSTTDTEAESQHSRTLQSQGGQELCIPSS